MIILLCFDRERAVTGLKLFIKNWQFEFSRTILQVRNLLVFHSFFGHFRSHLDNHNFHHVTDTLIYKPKIQSVTYIADKLSLIICRHITCFAISLCIPTFSGLSFLYLVRFRIAQTTWLRWLLFKSSEWDFTMYL